MISDFIAIKQLQPELLEKIADKLRAEENFLEPGNLNSILRSVVSDDASIDALRRIILNIKSEDVDDLIKQLKSSREDNPKEFPLSTDDIAQLEERLPKLLKPIPALRRYRKAERLAKITGQPLEDFQLICDLRPVFDEERKSVEGLIPITHMKIVATGGDGLPNVFEAELTAKQVNDLAEQVEKAKLKLDVLREKATQWAESGMPNIPSIQATDEG
ncbi:MAG: hypothetical protein Kow00105_01700 [Phycisphaeraceae bacterium]